MKATMFQRKQTDPTTADMPDTIGGWEMLDDTGAEKLGPILAERYPENNLVAVARRADNGQAACFDRGADGKGKAIFVVRVAGPTGIVRRYPGFTQWFDAAVAGKEED
jgi:hypothetical protein